MAKKIPEDSTEGMMAHDRSFDFPTRNCKPLTTVAKGNDTDTERRKIGHALKPIACFLIAWCVSSALMAGDRLRLIQAPIQAGRVCGLSGRWLQLPYEMKNAPRAWVGIIERVDGGPGRELIRYRNRQWVTRTLMPVSESESGLSKTELDARYRHCRDIKPRFFDGVLVQHKTSLKGQARCSWVIDWDVDQDLADESPEVATLSLVKPEGSIAMFNTSCIEVRNNAVHHPIRVHVDQPFAVAAEDDSGEVDPARRPAEKRTDQTSPKAIVDARNRLLKLDDISVRKQHLHDVVRATDILLEQLHQWDADRSEQDLQRRNDWIADAIYRRGRALGYMELPDVLAVQPIEDQEWLDTEFEATFYELEQRVDVTEPKYILLAIRRERRRGNRGLALTLVERYRKTHPDPVWYFKKRLDLLTELGATVHAHQAACEMWLKAVKPDRPICCVIRVTSQVCPSAQLEWGTWREEQPWRATGLGFHQVQKGQWEAVVWLKQPDEELSQRVLDTELSVGSPISCSLGTVRRFTMKAPASH